MEERIMSRILIIEDEEAIADLEKDYLELSGFEVQIQHQGDEGPADFNNVIVLLVRTHQSVISCHVRLDPGNQLAGAERFGDIVVRPKSKSPYFVNIVLFGRCISKRYGKRLNMIPQSLSTLRRFGEWDIGLRYKPEFFMSQFSVKQIQGINFLKRCIFFIFFRQRNTKQVFISTYKRKVANSLLMVVITRQFCGLYPR